MKKIIVFCLVVTTLIIGYVVLIKNDQSNKYNYSIQKENIYQDQNFDLNINALTYQLPAYTKICLPKTRFDCSSDGCKKSKPVVFVLYDENTNQTYRCGEQDCDRYHVSKEISGLYVNLTPIIPNGSLIKMSVDNKYVETVSAGLAFIIQTGECTIKNKF